MTLPFNGFCPALQCFAGAIPCDDCGNGYVAVIAYKDGNPITLGHYDTEEEAEVRAGEEVSKLLEQKNQMRKWGAR